VVRHTCIIFGLFTKPNLVPPPSRKILATPLTRCNTRETVTTTALFPCAVSYISAFPWWLLFSPTTARAGSGVVRIDPLRFLAGCRKRRLNQALSVLSLSLGFF